MSHHYTNQVQMVQRGRRGMEGDGEKVEGEIDGQIERVDGR